MDFLTQQNRRNAGDTIPEAEEISAAGKHVVVIGGGDTGSDCIGTSRRQGAASITQIELLPKPPDDRLPTNPWPMWPVVLRTSSSQEEGCERMWSVQTKELLGEKEGVRKLSCVKLDWSGPDRAGRRTFKEIPGSAFELRADLVLLAMGFVHVEHGPLVRDLGVATDVRGNLVTDLRRPSSSSRVRSGAARASGRTADPGPGSRPQASPATTRSPGSSH